MMYSYSVPNGNIQQQQLLPVPVSMAYGAHGNTQQQQQYVYMQQQQQQQQQQQTSTTGGYSYDQNSSGHSDGGGDSIHQQQQQQQSRYSSQQSYPRQQQSLYQSNSAPRDQGSRQRNGWLPSGGRNDKQNGSSSLSNNYQEDDLYAPLDSNGEISTRSLSSSQRPTEGTHTIYLCRQQ